VVGKAGFDTAMHEVTGDVARLAAHVLFGSHATMCAFESAMLKMKVAALGANDAKLLMSGNAIVPIPQQ
jgi:hypothetical protein